MIGGTGSLFTFFGGDTVVVPDYMGWYDENLTPLLERRTDVSNGVMVADRLNTVPHVCGTVTVIPDADLSTSQFSFNLNPVTTSPQIQLKVKDDAGTVFAGLMPFLPDPGADRIVYWNEAINNFDYMTGGGADSIVFWDFSAGAFAFLTIGSGLSIAGTTITATGGGPSTAARVGLDAAITIADATPTSIIWDREDYDQDDYWDVGSPTVFTIPADGNYTVGCFIMWDTGKGDNFSVYLKNQDGTLLSGDLRATILSETARVNVNYTGAFEEADWIEVVVEQDTGFPLDVRIDSLFWIAKL